MTKVNFINPEYITEAEVIEIFKKYPIDFVRVRDFLNREPGIREAFLQYSTTYVTDFANMVGIELRPNVYARLQETLITCLTVGYLTRQNLFKRKLDESIKEGEKDGSASTG